MSKIEQELQKATKVKATEDRPAYLKALHEAAMELSEENWDALSDAAQKWANAATKAVEKDKPIADFISETKADEAEDNSEEETVSDKKAKTATKAAAKPAAKKPAAKAEAEETEAEDEPAPKKAAKPAPKAVKEKAAPAPKAKKAPGKIERMKVVILKNLKLKPEDLKVKLTAAGIEGVADSTITTVRSDMLGTIRVLQKAGKLSEDLIDLD